MHTVRSLHRRTIIESKWVQWNLLKAKFIYVCVFHHQTVSYYEFFMANWWNSIELPLHFVLNIVGRYDVNASVCIHGHLPFCSLLLQGLTIKYYNPILQNKVVQQNINIEIRERIKRTHTNERKTCISLKSWSRIDQMSIVLRWHSFMFVCLSIMYNQYAIPLNEEGK